MPTLADWFNRLKRDFKIAMLPHKPGAYRLLDRGGGVIHVGAADDLAIRVGEHFSADEANAAIKQNACDFQFEVAGSEDDAKALSQRWNAERGAPPPG